MEGFVPPPIRVARSSSVASELTGDDGSSVFVECEETSILESQVREESTPTEWTDEKHSLYLNSMEASFVNQLYNCTDLLSWRSQQDCSSDPKSSKQMLTSTCIPSGQFKVLRDGCWGKVNFRREKSQLNNGGGSRVLSANPWIRHFRSGCRNQIVKSSALQEKAALATTSNRFPVSHSHLCRPDSVGSNSDSSQLHFEGTDQNFVDEVVERKKASTKRMKTSVVATSSTDQVVPYANFPVTEDVAENRVFPKE